MPAISPERGLVSVSGFHRYNPPGRDLRKFKNRRCQKNFWPQPPPAETLGSLKFAKIARCISGTRARIGKRFSKIEQDRKFLKMLSKKFLAPTPPAETLGSLKACISGSPIQRGLDQKYRYRNRYSRFSPFHKRSISSQICSKIARSNPPRTRP